GNTTLGENWSCRLNVTDGNRFSDYNQSNEIEIKDYDVLIKLNYPEDEHVAQSNEVTFYYRLLNKTQINNCTLLLDGNVSAVEYAFDGGVIGNSVNTIEYSFTSSGNYNWTINCTDTSGIKYSATETRAITAGLESEPPIVNLLSPADDTLIAGTNYVDFKFNVTDNTGIDYCDLIIDNVTRATNGTITNASTNLIRKMVAKGDHDWYINCTDGFDNVGKSAETWNVSVNQSPVITQCGFEIDTADTYYVDNDLHCEGEDAIELKTYISYETTKINPYTGQETTTTYYTGQNLDGVIIDCQGHTLYGDKTNYGILWYGDSDSHHRDESLRNSHFRNCTFNNFSKAIYFHGSSYAKVRNRVDGCHYTDRKSRAISNWIENCTFENNTEAINFRSYEDEHDGDGGGWPCHDMTAAGDIINNKIVNSTFRNNNYSLYFTNKDDGDDDDDGGDSDNDANVKDGSIYGNIFNVSHNYHIYMNSNAGTGDIDGNPKDNSFYNNYFANEPTGDYIYSGSLPNYWNITYDYVPGSRRNVVGGDVISGNYWIDYTGEDTTGDGVGETPYSFASNPPGTTYYDYQPLTGPILRCGDTIEENTTLYLDLRNDSDGNICPEHGLIVANESIILDCDNYDINGSGIIGSIGLNISSYDNVGIRNCNVNNFDEAMRVENATNTTLVNDNFSYSNYGLMLGNSYETNSSLVEFYYDNYAVYIRNSSNNLFGESNIEHGNYSIYLHEKSQNNKFYNTDIFDFDYGFYLNGLSHNNTFENGSIHHGETAIKIGTDNNTLTNFSIQNNTVGANLTSFSEGNWIYHNYFNNTNEAYDSGTGNKWNASYTCGEATWYGNGPWPGKGYSGWVNGSCRGGNFWSNYNGLDLSLDGVGNTEIPYDNNGNMNGKDYLPLTDAKNHYPSSSLNWPPYDGIGLDEVYQILNLTVYDEDIVETPYMNVSFYYSNHTYWQDPSYSLVGENLSSVTNGSYSTYNWTGLNNHTTYHWYGNVTDSWIVNQSDIFNFTTYNNPIDSIVTEDPTPDGKINASIDPFLNVTITDPDPHDSFTVRFYDASDDSLIGTVYNVSNGGNATVRWNRRLYGLNYSWYVNATDDATYPRDAKTVQSDVFTFIVRNVTCNETVNRSVPMMPNLNCTGDGLIIDNSSIYINGTNNTLSGDGDAGDYGIVMKENTAHDHINITNIRINNFQNAVRFKCVNGNPCTDLRVEDSHFNASTGDCIYVEDISDISIINNSERNTALAYWGFNSADWFSTFNFKHNDFTGSIKARCNFFNISYNEINTSHRLNAYQKVAKVIDLDTDDYPVSSIVSFNNLTGKGSTYFEGYSRQGVIEMNDCDLLKIFNNTIKTIDSYAIDSRLSSNVEVYNNYIINQSSIDSDGIRFGGGNGMDVHNNTFEKMRFALRIQASDMDVRGNEFLNCTDSPFYFYQSYGENFFAEDNFISNKGNNDKLDYGIYIPGHNPQNKTFNNNKFINLDTGMYLYHTSNMHLNDNNFTDVNDDLSLASPTEGGLGENYYDRDTYWIDVNNNNTFDGKYAITIEDKEDFVIDGWNNFSFFMFKNISNLTIRNIEFNNHTKWAWTIDNCSNVNIYNTSYLSSEGFLDTRKQQYMIFLVTEDVSFRDSTFTSDDKDSGTALLFYDNSSNFVFDNITIQGFDAGIVNNGWYSASGDHYSGPDPDAFSENVTVKNCFINTSFVGLHFEDLYNSSIKHNNLYSEGYGGIMIVSGNDNYHSISNSSYNVSIYNNSLNDCSSRGILIKQSERINIYNNTLFDSTIKIGRLSSEGGGGASNKITLEDNWINNTNVNLNGISIDFHSGRGGDIICRRNNISNPVRGIYAYAQSVNGGYINNISIHDNNIFNSNLEGILLYASNASEIFNNNITSSNKGITIGGSHLNPSILNQTLTTVHDNLLEDIEDYAFSTKSYGP
ncbi:hypothetical protein GF378_00160, partial [Candidatus Pacearchaeota archaeon]|nr:hypothetical protein [Candidatus Pacearchaeota archaeon]